jgi:hypothetical protein
MHTLTSLEGGPWVEYSPWQVRLPCA